MGGRLSGRYRMDRVIVKCQEIEEDVIEAAVLEKSKDGVTAMGGGMIDSGCDAED